ncbi:MAG: hypothetical protein COZ80_03170 [Ignavibacteria bacterium CG_4_8_14_3_um_filter_37_9]|nr:hypothetical protein [Ignavibacteria bacterium]OIO15911.1 MAG: hypothetical protein AUJ54_12010 [Ignavibacteria bacterium CG1_02_37_35]PIS45690.1 MAG: hypothetical protein COT22_03925 [Ignavibacteria bacterium CG08_land_8_20_14_0_20_37_9]PIW99858.1 MAG: hypothetical protein COZ80_03170 [Ignavibacteria bacterium CG_4_8_14_3_um_filter_37_9]PIX94781.1 MAG: hypothetical protein COZ25_03805 [Ignavibacteria bacterium CG_4_10_14_3_um_filter_37_18]PJC59542.1 MAG: hypothetical protein CO025_05870 [I
MTELYKFSEENLLKQVENGKFELGFYRIKFFTKDGMLSDIYKDEVSEFYLYPSGGTLRDKDFNIVFYSSKFDTYRGFVPPHQRNDS